MYLFMKYLIFVTLFFLLFSCSTKNEALELALQQAGTNRPELEKVLAHYQNDSLKYQAAVFLIKNMPYYEYQVSPEIDSIKTLLMHIFKKGDLTEAERQKGVSWQEETSNVTYKQDIKEVKASMLIENIDYAFKVWKEKPWNKNLSFEDKIFKDINKKVDSEEKIKSQSLKNSYSETKKYIDNIVNLSLSVQQENPKVYSKKEQKNGVK